MSINDVIQAPPYEYTTLTLTLFSAPALPHSSQLVTNRSFTLKGTFQGRSCLHPRPQAIAMIICGVSNVDHLLLRFRGSPIDAALGIEWIFLLVKAVNDPINGVEIFAIIVSAGWPLVLAYCVFSSTNP